MTIGYLFRKIGALLREIPGDLQSFWHWFLRLELQGILRTSCLVGAIFVLLLLVADIRDRNEPVGSRIGELLTGIVVGGAFLWTALSG